jgi:hypothetical protein
MPVPGRGRGRTKKGVQKERIKDARTGGRRRTAKKMSSREKRILKVLEDIEKSK